MTKRQQYLLTPLLATGLLVASNFISTLTYAQTSLIAQSGIAEVKTDAGNIQGFIKNGITTFRGIPYATAERFMPPKKIEPWKNTRRTLSYGNICPQTISSQLREPQTFVADTQYWPASENCQNLNVWTQSLSDNKKRPVMVWLHGGGFVSGSSMELPLYDGANLTRSGDVVVVSVNHRLNVLGFLDLSAYGENYKYSGNVGMLDIVAALQWVKNNIAQFGGDPNNVTIFGQSGGGAKVATLLTTPSAKGLFHKAIVQSGAPGGVMRTGPDNTLARRVAELTLEFSGVKSTELEKLSEISYDELTSAANQALAAVSQEQRSGPGLLGGPGISWGPVIDKDFLPVSPFESQAPEVSKGIPLMVGSTLSEFENINPHVAARRNWSVDQVKEFLQQMRGENAEKIYAAYEKAYPELAPAVRLSVESMFRSGVLRTADLKAKQGDPVYSYIFAWRSPVLDYAWAAGHSAELSFIFDNFELGIQSHGGGPVVEKLHEQMSQAWARFAHTGNPNHPGMPEWAIYTEQNPATMVFDDEPDLRIDFDTELIKLLSVRPER
ncbi:carboxylesterase/lipase family protein [Aurantivibrio infirmus]